MGDEDQISKKLSVPSWQLGKTDKEPNKATIDSTAPPAQSPSSDRAAVIETAQKFLQDDEVRNAPTDKQVAFLEEKGLTSDEIESLLGIRRNSEASNPESPTPSSNTTETPKSTQTSQSSSQLQNARDPPPIITYPEFLTTPPQSPPLITPTRLLNTLYLFSGLSFLLYGTNSYLLTPMFSSLTASRQEFAQTALVNIDKFNARLSELVSEQPPNSNSNLLEPYKDGKEPSDTDSDSDPTELFHRDIGVQTSRPASPSLSSSPSPPDDDESAITSQTKDLVSLTTDLSSLISTAADEELAYGDISTEIRELRDYLDGLAYTASSMGMGAYKYGAYSHYGSGAGKTMKSGDEEDEIAGVKREIRGLKGVLLSARSFPGGGAAGRVR